MHKTRVISATLLALALVVTTAHADWNPGFKHKMHFPQQPDVNGYDVNFTAPLIVADDWKCSETGPVTDIHFWFSARNDWLNLQLPLDVQIFNIHVSIHEDIPAGPVIPFSRPGAQLWARDFNVGQVKIRKYGSGQQSWYDPSTGLLVPNDHTTIYQCNIINIPEAFYQKRGHIYWLDVSITAQQPLGWKSADLFKYPPGNYGQHYQDDATWTPGAAVGWQDIHYPSGPLQGQSMDMAFVITGYKRPLHHKMHFQQYPDPTGADVNFTFPRVAADDWKCSETGPVDDIHFWFSAFNDWLDPAHPLEQQIFNIHVSIHADIPDPDGPQGPLFSMPGALLWSRDFPVTAANVKVVRYFTEGQAWYDPTQGYVPLNHKVLWRCDLTEIVQPFIQQVGTIYWLDVSLTSEAPVGWKTADVDAYPPPFTGQHYQDDAVWGNFPAPIWTDLHWPVGIPHGGESIDLSFVITTGPPNTGAGDSPKSFRLEQNVPNPFNPTTTIRYTLPDASDVELAVFSVDGRLVRVLQSGAKPAGTFEATWDGRDSAGRSVASGVYFYRLRAGSFAETKKMVLLK